MKAAQILLPSFVFPFLHLFPLSGCTLTSVLYTKARITKADWMGAPGAETLVKLRLSGCRAVFFRYNELALSLVVQAAHNWTNSDNLIMMYFYS